MKRFFALLLTLLVTCALSACGNGNASADSVSPSSPSMSQMENSALSESRILVAYFSATGNTAGVAASLQTILGADGYEIVPAQAYSNEDLNYSNDDCRANREQNDPDARPAVENVLENPEDYDVVFLGYPIWWGQAPKILFTFLENNDFTGKTIVPFCTSGSSRIELSVEELRTLVPDANWLPGMRFSAGASEADVADWVESLNLASSQE